MENINVKELVCSSFGIELEEYEVWCMQFPEFVKPEFAKLIFDNLRNKEVTYEFSYNQEYYTKNSISEIFKYDEFKEMNLKEKVDCMIEVSIFHKFREQFQNSYVYNVNNEIKRIIKRMREVSGNLADFMSKKQVSKNLMYDISTFVMNAKVIRNTISGYLEEYYRANPTEDILVNMTKDFIELNQKIGLLSEISESDPDVFKNDYSKFVYYMESMVFYLENTKGTFTEVRKLFMYKEEIMGEDGNWYLVENLFDAVYTAEDKSEYYKAVTTWYDNYTKDLQRLYTSNDFVELVGRDDQEYYDYLLNQKILKLFGTNYNNIRALVEPKFKITNGINSIVTLYSDTFIRENIRDRTIEALYERSDDPSITINELKDLVRTKAIDVQRILAGKGPNDELWNYEIGSYTPELEFSNIRVKFSYEEAQEIIITALSVYDNPSMKDTPLKFKNFNYESLIREAFFENELNLKTAFYTSDNIVFAISKLTIMVTGYVEKIISQGYKKFKFEGEKGKNLWKTPFNKGEIKKKNSRTLSYDESFLTSQFMIKVKSFLNYKIVRNYLLKLFYKEGYSDGIVSIVFLDNNFLFENLLSSEVIFNFELASSRKILDVNKKIKEREGELSKFILPNELKELKEEIKKEELEKHTNMLNSLYNEMYKKIISKDIKGLSPNNCTWINNTLISSNLSSLENYLAVIIAFSLYSIIINLDLKPSKFGKSEEEGGLKLDKFTENEVIDFNYIANCFYNTKFKVESLDSLLKQLSKSVKLEEGMKLDTKSYFKIENMLTITHIFYLELLLNLEAMSNY